MRLGLVEVPENTFVEGLGHVERVYPNQASCKLVKLAGIDGVWVSITALGKGAEKYKTTFLPVHQCGFAFADGSELSVDESGALPVVKVTQAAKKAAK